MPPLHPRARLENVDVIVEVVTLVDYHRLEKELLEIGFRHDLSPDAPICRWTVGSALVNVMPSDARVLGFGNRWYRDAIRTAEPFALPKSGTIRLITAPLFLATKLEAFRGRGGGDYYGGTGYPSVAAGGRVASRSQGSGGG